MKTFTKIKAAALVGCLMISARAFSQSPGITQNPTNVIAFPGQNVMFTVGASNGPFTYQWQSSPTGLGVFSNLLDGGQISDSTEPSLMINGVTAANAADFRVIVANISGMTTSSVARLSVWTSYTINLTNGLTLIANQLDHGSNTLNEIMPSVPDGSIIYKYNNAKTNWSEAYFSSAVGVWLPPGISLNPGEGAFFQSPTNFTLTFTGAPKVPVLPLNIPDGTCYLVSLQTNDIGDYLSIVGAAPEDGTAMFLWNGTEYTEADNFFGMWTSGNSSNGPAIPVGQSVWISPSGDAGPTALAVPPLMVSLPQPAQLVAVGSNAVLSATMNGLTTLTYQWYKNTVPIPGANANTLSLSNVSLNDTGYYNLAASNVYGLTFTAPTLLRATQLLTDIPSNMIAADFGDMPATNWACWESSFFDQNNDCKVQLVFTTVESDPLISYPTTLAQNGARNSLSANSDLTWLGTDVSPTYDGTPNAAAVGDPGPGLTLTVPDEPGVFMTFGSVYTRAGYLQEENGIRMIPCPYQAPTTINENAQTAGNALDQTLMFDPRFDVNGPGGTNLFGSTVAYFTTNENGLETNYVTVFGERKQCWTPGNLVWFTVEAYNKDDLSSYFAGVSYLNVWIDYGNSNGTAGAADGVFQPDEYVIIDQPIYGSDMLQYLTTVTGPPFDTGASVPSSAGTVAQAIANHYGLSQPVPSIGVQPYASNGLQVLSLTLPSDLGSLTCGKNTFVRFRLTKEPLNLWNVYNPATGSSNVLGPVSGTPPTGIGYNTYGLSNSSGMPDPSVGLATGGGEVEDYAIGFGSCNPIESLGAAGVCFTQISSSTSLFASILPFIPISTTMVLPISTSQTTIDVAPLPPSFLPPPAPPFFIEVQSQSNTNWYELMEVTATNSTGGGDDAWSVIRDTPHCEGLTNFFIGDKVMSVRPCDCGYIHGTPLPAGLINVSGTDPGGPCNLAILPSTNTAPVLVEQLPDQFLLGNYGPGDLSGVIVTYTIPTNGFLEFAASSQGTSSNFGPVVSFNLGTLEAGQVARIGVKILPYTYSGTNVTFVHNFSVTADQPLNGSTTFQTANTVQIKPLLSIVPGSTNSATLLWLTNNPTVTLQQNTNLSGPWSNAPVQAPPYNFPMTNPVQFFRLGQ